MSKIKVMSAELANMIAAGEVIERPSSVIKELVENSIDAEATQIDVQIIDAGRKLISVKDDGYGMEREDAVLAFKRHASSKIKSVFDLMRITSLGFRGEAVPSIASVAKVNCITSDGINDGCKIISEPGKDLLVEDASFRKGTTFEIKELFFNTPARLKYLKGDKTENLSSIETLEHLALCFPHIAFSLSIDSKLIFKTNGRGDLLETIANVYGNDIAKKALKMNFEGDSFSFDGYICSPSVSYSSRYDILTFLNERTVYIPKVQKSIIDAYKDYLPPNRYPLVILPLEVDYSLVDVNVHPTKREVRLSIEDELANTIYKEVKKTLAKTRSSFVDVKIPEVSGSYLVDKRESLDENSFINEKATLNSEIKPENNSEVVSNTPTSLFDLFNEEDNSNTDIVPSIERPFKVSDSKGYMNDSTALPSFEEKSLFPEIFPLGQVLETYIICDSADGLYIVDQHAAAERINFEKCEEGFKNQKDKVIPLFPLVIDLPRSSFINYDSKHIELLNSFGIVTSLFGGNTIKVDEIPSFLKDKDDDSILRDIIIETLKDNSVDINGIERLTIASKACKMSIKANRRLTHDEQISLLNQLSRCKNPLNCPHGRPTIIKISKYDIEKLFKRTGF